jgi:hypothetical protein
VGPTNGEKIVKQPEKRRLTVDEFRTEYLITFLDNIFTFICYFYSFITMR